jgi:hypothetical protein
MYCYIPRVGKEPPQNCLPVLGECDRSGQGIQPWIALYNLRGFFSLYIVMYLLVFVAPELWAPAYPLFACLSGELSINYSHRHESAAFDKRVKPVTEYSQTESVWPAEKDCLRFSPQ